MEKIDLILISVYFVAFVFSLLMGKLLFFKIQKEVHHALFTLDRRSTSVAFASFLLSISLAFFGLILSNVRLSIQDELINLAIYIPTALVLIVISSFIHDKIFFSKINNRQALFDGNTALGVAESGSYISTGIILMSCFTGTDSHYLSAVVMFVVSQLFLFLFYWLYEFITPYKFRREIINNNLAVGIAIAGNKIAFSILMIIITWGNFTSWTIFIQDCLIYGFGAIAYLLVLRFIFASMVFPTISINEEISRDRNTGVGLFEACIAITYSILTVLILI